MAQSVELKRLIFSALMQVQMTILLVQVILIHKKMSLTLKTQLPENL